MQSIDVHAALGWQYANLEGALTHRTSSKWLTWQRDCPGTGRSVQPPGGLGGTAARGPRDQSNLWAKGARSGVASATPRRDPAVRVAGGAAGHARCAAGKPRIRAGQSAALIGLSNRSGRRLAR